MQQRGNSLALDGSWDVVTQCGKIVQEARIEMVLCGELAKASEGWRRHPSRDFDVVAFAGCIVCLGRVASGGVYISWRIMKWVDQCAFAFLRPCVGRIADASLGGCLMTNAPRCGC